MLNIKEESAPVKKTGPEKNATSIMAHAQARANPAQAQEQKIALNAPKTRI